MQATAEYGRAAAWPTTFYGQLTALALGQGPSGLNTRILNVPTPGWTTEEALDFAGREVARASAFLVAWNEPRRAYNFLMDLGPIAAWGLDHELHHVKIDPATCATSMPGVFAIGDVVTYPGKLKLILQGFSEAAVAAHAIFRVVRPGEALHFEYSTTSGVPRGS